MVIAVVAKNLIQQPISCREVDGIIVELRTQMMVEGLDAPDFNALWQALNNPNVPIQNDPPPKLGGVQKFPNLVLTERIPAIVESSPTKARIDLVYTSLGGDGQRLQEGGTIGSGSVTLQQVTTERYDAASTDDSGNRTITDTQITVKHTFSDGTATDDAGTIPKDEHGRGGKTIVQSGEISALVPNASFNLTGLIQGDDPMATSLRWIGRVNSEAWNGGAARTWRITNAGFEPHGIGNLDVSREQKVWFRFTFTFELKDVGWDSDVVFIDPHTGSPPRGLVKGEGFKTIPFPKEAAFKTLFNPSDNAAGETE